jgi:hypothetical protein
MTDNFLQLSGDVVNALVRVENNQHVHVDDIRCGFLKKKLQKTEEPSVRQWGTFGKVHEVQRLGQTFEQKAFFRLASESFLLRSEHFDGSLSSPHCARIWCYY